VSFYHTNEDNDLKGESVAEGEMYYNISPIATKIYYHFIELQHCTVTKNRHSVGLGCKLTILDRIINTYM
jgi:hypothetical protein